MACKICKHDEVIVIYDDKIRYGAFGTLTKSNYKMYKCKHCQTIWHEIKPDEFVDYYESETYRSDVDGGGASLFYSNSDAGNIHKLSWIGTGKLRGKTIADIGCAAGSLLDLMSGLAEKIVAIEPSLTFREELKRKGFEVFGYADEAVAAHVQADLVTTFDVIEHVEDPSVFVKQIYELCKAGGHAIIGTPTEYAIACELIGHDWNQFNFRYQHPWVLTKKALEIMAEDAGFTIEKTVYKQRYSLSNLLLWMKEKKPCGNKHLSFVSERLEEEFVKSCEEMEVADYILIYLIKRS